MTESWTVRKCLTWLFLAVGAILVASCGGGPPKQPEILSQATGTMAPTPVPLPPLATRIPTAETILLLPPTSGPTLAWTPAPSPMPICPQSRVIAPSPRPLQSALDPKITFSGGTPDEASDIYIMNPDGTGLTRMTYSSARDSNPAWSPDGQRIAFYSERSGNADIYIMGREGEAGGLTQLTNDPANDYDPSWSPDGQRIVFMSDRDGNREIYLMDADGSNVRRRTYTAEKERQPAWSPLGQIITFESQRTGSAQIFAMCEDGSSQYSLTNSVGYNVNPKWSPDGRRIVFASVRDPGNQQNNWPEIYIMDSSGTNQIRLTYNLADDGTPAWSPDGQWVIFSSKLDGCNGQRADGKCDWDLFRMRPDGSDVARLTNTPDQDEINAVWWGP